MRSATTTRSEEPLAPAPAALLNLPHVTRTFWRGMAVYTYEDPATHLYVVLGGRVKILRSSADGQNKILAIRYRGDLFGELALAGPAVEAQRSDEAVALETTRVALIRVEDFWRARGSDPVALQGVLGSLTARLAEAHRQIEALVFDDNHRRLARALIELTGEAERAGERSVRLTHEELAELIGSTREVVTGLMIEMRQRGLIEYKRGDVRPRLPRLTQFLAGE